jgi:hypothetical protein
VELASKHDFRIVPFDKTGLATDDQKANWQAACDQANQDMAANIIVPAVWDAIAKVKAPCPVDAG